MWANKIRYLGIFSDIHTFTCSLESAKRSFYRAANAVFGKIFRTGSEEVTSQVTKSKCLPMLQMSFAAVSQQCCLATQNKKQCWQIFTVSITLVVNNFTNYLFTAKFSAHKADTVSGHTSKPHNSIGKHLLLMTCKVTPSEAVLHILPKTAFAAPTFGPHQRTLEKSGFYYNYV